MIINKTLLLLIIATISALLPPIFIKKYTFNGDNKFGYIWLLISLILYIILIYSYVNIFDGRELGTYYIILQVLQIIIAIPISIILFKEKFSFMKILGIFLGASSIFILSYYA